MIFLCCSKFPLPLRQSHEPLPHTL
jgi:hypothetical protein